MYNHTSAMSHSHVCWQSMFQGNSMSKRRKKRSGREADHGCYRCDTNGYGGKCFKLSVNVGNTQHNANEWLYDCICITNSTRRFEEAEIGREICDTDRGEEAHWTETIKNARIIHVNNDYGFLMMKLKQDGWCVCKMKSQHTEEERASQFRASVNRSTHFYETRLRKLETFWNFQGFRIIRIKVRSHLAHSLWFFTTNSAQMTQ